MTDRVTGGYALTELVTRFLTLAGWADNWAKLLVEPAANRTCLPQPPGGP